MQLMVSFVMDFEFAANSEKITQARRHVFARFA